MPRYRPTRQQVPSNGSTARMDIVPVLRPGDPTFDAALAVMGPGAEADHDPMSWDAPVIAAMGPLSDRQRAFVLAFSWMGSATYGHRARSAIVSGITYNTSHKWMAGDAVPVAIKAVHDQAFARMGIDSGWVLREQLRLYEEAAAIDTVERRVRVQSGILEQIAQHKAVGAKAAERIEHSHKHTFEEITERRASVMRARREANEKGLLQ